MNLIRQIEVLIGPLTEKQGGGDVSLAARYFSDGSMDGVRVTAQIQKSKISMPNASRITLFNLSADTRAMLTTPNIVIIVNAGYKDQGLHQIFKGGVLGSYSERQGTDIITHIMAMTGWVSITDKPFIFTGKKGFLLKDIVSLIASKMDGVVVEPSRIKVKDFRFSSGGWSFSSPSIKNSMDNLARVYGFTWTITDNVFQAITDGETFDDYSFLDGENGSLISITPILNQPYQQVVGTKIKAFLLPMSIPGSQLAVNSTISPSLNGTYEIHTIDYKLDTFGPEWTMDIQCMKQYLNQQA